MAKSFEEKLQQFKEKLDKANLTENQTKEILERADHAKSDEDVGHLYKILAECEDLNKAKIAEVPKTAPRKRELDPLEDFEDWIRSDEKAQKFMMMYVLADKVKGPEDLKDEIKIRQFLADFEAWKKAGEPGISMPKLPKSEIAFPTAIYRLADRKEEKMYFYNSNGTEEGITYTPKYEQIENPTSGELEDTTIKIGQTESYNMKFDIKKAKQLIDSYDKLAPPGTNPLKLYFWIGDNKQSISEDNFFKSRDELVQMFNNKQPLN